MDNPFQGRPSYTLGPRTWRLLLSDVLHRHIFPAPLPSRSIWIFCRIPSLLCAFLGFGVPASMPPISIKLVPESPLVGGQVLLTPSYDGPRYNVHWYRGPGHALGVKDAILAYNTEFNLTHFGYNFSGRETIYGDGSLQITNLTIGDAGSYTVEIITSSDPVKATVQLTVSA